MPTQIRRVCTICARSGSKGLPGKNVRILGDKPLFAHSIAQARALGVFDEIVVSSDSSEILETASDYGATSIVARPAALASDSAGKLDAIVHAVRAAVQNLDALEEVIDLDVTSPLRSLQDIRGVLSLLRRSGAESVITASASRRSPSFNMVRQRPDGTVALALPPRASLVRRQDAPPLYDMNASVYAWRASSLLAEPRIFYPTTRMLVMPDARSVDIDTPLDFDIVEFLMSRNLGATDDARG